MIYDLPYSVNINGEIHPIRNKCDFRVILDVISALNDVELTNDEKIKCALVIFYGDILKINDFETAINEMFKIINGGEEPDQNDNSKPQLMDWEHDFSQIVPPVSRVLGYEVRMPEKYTHWYSFLGAYHEIGDCTFQTIVSIRSKRAKGKKLENWEIDFIRENRKIVDLPLKLTADEQKLLNSEW